MSDTPSTLYCANHPSVETGLRCKTCDKPICPKCAVLTPTGYRCKECVRTQQKVFDTAVWYDFPIAFVIAGLLSFAGSFLARFLGIFIIFVAAIIGVAIAEAVRYAIRRHRSPQLFLVAAIGAAAGSVILMLPTFFALLLYGLGAFTGGLWSLLWQGFYAVTITTTVYYRLRGINIR
jgi:hypothetical protein